MAKEEAFQFIVRVNEDTALQDKLTTITGDNDVESIVNLGREAGFNFTSEEFQSVALKLWEARHPDQIAENELDTIAGGGNLPLQPGLQLSSGTSVIRNLTPPPPGNVLKW